MQLYIDIKEIISHLEANPYRPRILIASFLLALLLNN